MPRELLHRFAAVVRTDIVYENADGELTAYFDNVDVSPLMRDCALRQSLCERAAAHACPYALRDEFNA